jgi:hypothetical protein
MKLGRLWGLAAAAFLVVGWGCSSSTRIGPGDLGTVQGNVTFNGKPVPGGVLSFAAQVGQIRIAGPEVMVAKNGAYKTRLRIGTNYATLQLRPTRGKTPQVDKEVSLEVKQGENTQDLSF